MVRLINGIDDLVECYSSKIIADFDALGWAVYSRMDTALKTVSVGPQDTLGACIDYCVLPKIPRPHDYSQMKHAISLLTINTGDDLPHLPYIQAQNGKFSFHNLYIGENGVMHFKDATKGGSMILPRFAGIVYTATHLQELHLED